MRFITALAVAATLAASYACGGSPTGPSGGSGTLTLMLKDSPYTDAKSLLVTFSEVSAHRSDQPDNGWTKLTFSGGATSRTCDLKKLEKAQDILGLGSLATGHYTMIRLTVSSATVYFQNATPAADPACAPTINSPGGSSASVDIPSGEVKLNREFDITTTNTTMLVDFDGDKSVRDTGNGRFMMSPVIGIVSVQ
jgi:hypothetical protein